jgi:moderate conductance mechanosensitive channel
VIFAIATLTILPELDINLAPLLASAGIVGVAVGFGAQSLVKDVISGMFMLLEDQYGVGDSVDVGQASGTVEAVGLRITTIRDGNGVLWYLRNGEIARVGNRSQSWAMVLIDVPVGFGAPVEEATAALSRAVEELGEDEGWAADFIEAPSVLGVQQLTIDGAVLRVQAKTTADAQGRVGLELRRRITAALERAGLAAHLDPRRFARGNVPGGAIEP